MSAASVRENEASAIIGQVTVSDPDKGQQHRCTVHDLIVDAASSSERLVLSPHFTVDSSFNLKTLTGLNFETEHSVMLLSTAVMTAYPIQNCLSSQSKVGKKLPRNHNQIANSLHIVT